MAAKKAKPRRIQIQNKLSNILKAEVTGPQFHGPGWFSGFEDYHNPRLREIRQKYRIDSAVQGETNEWRKILKLRNWVKSRWHVDNNQNRGGDAFDILELAKQGYGFYCSHSATVQNAVFSAYGIVTRKITSDRSWDDYGRSIHHGMNEVWSNDFAKWILVDAKYNNHFEKAGVPLSALETHEAVRKNGGRGVTMHTGVRRRITRQDNDDRPEASALNYWWVAYPLSSQTHTHPHYSGPDRLLIPDNEYYRTTTWYRGTLENGKPRKHWAYTAKTFVPVKNRYEIDWTPNVADLTVSQRSEKELSVRIQSATPNFKAYRIRTGGGDWRSISRPGLRLQLKGKTTTLEVCARNLCNVDGPIVKLSLTTR